MGFPSAFVRMKSLIFFVCIYFTAFLPAKCQKLTWDNAAFRCKNESNMRLLSLGDDWQSKAKEIMKATTFNELWANIKSSVKIRWHNGTYADYDTFLSPSQVRGECIIFDDKSLLAVPCDRGQYVLCKTSSGADCDPTPMTLQEARNWCDLKNGEIWPNIPVPRKVVESCKLKERGFWIDVHLVRLERSIIEEKENHSFPHNRCMMQGDEDWTNKCGLLKNEQGKIICLLADCSEKHTFRCENPQALTNGTGGLLHTPDVANDVTLYTQHESTKDTLAGDWPLWQIVLVITGGIFLILLITVVIMKRQPCKSKAAKKHVPQKKAFALRNGMSFQAHYSDFEGKYCYEDDDLDVQDSRDASTSAGVPECGTTGRITTGATSGLYEDLETSTSAFYTSEEQQGCGAYSYLDSQEANTSGENNRFLTFKNKDKDVIEACETRKANESCLYQAIRKKGMPFANTKENTSGAKKHENG